MSCRNLMVNHQVVVQRQWRRNPFESSILFSPPTVLGMKLHAKFSGDAREQREKTRTRRYKPLRKSMWKIHTPAKNSCAFQNY